MRLPQYLMSNELTALGRKILLDRYAKKAPKNKPAELGDLVLLCTDKDTGKREIGNIIGINNDARTVRIRTESGQDHDADLEEIDRPIETTSDEILLRVAKALAKVEEKPKKWEKNFKELMDNWKFVPAGRILTGAGIQHDTPLTWFNCNVIPAPKDSREGILETAKTLAELFSRGAGVGTHLSSLRPRYAYVKGVNGRSSGAVSWGSLYSHLTGLIEQGGSRRGATMLVLHVWHPDIYEFIECKREPKAKQLMNLADKLEYGMGLTELADEARSLAAAWPTNIAHANLSVGITDDFMEAVIHDREWQLIFPDTTSPDYTTLWDGDIQKWRAEGRPIKIHKVVKARDLWEKIRFAAWDSGEPGVIYIDTINSNNTTWWYCHILAINPCGEQPLPSWYGVCNLGSLNLPRFLMNDPTNLNKIILNKKAYKNAIHMAMRFLDNVIDATPYFFEEQKINAQRERRVGLSPYLGLAEALIVLGIRYGSEEALDFINDIGAFVAIEAIRASVELAKEKGCCPIFATEDNQPNLEARQKFIEGRFIQRVLRQMLPEERQHLEEDIKAFGLRNVSFLTSAPTGTTGNMVATSTGIEPYFKFEYRQRTNLGEHIKRERVVDEWYRQHGENAELPDYFVSADILSPKDHVKMQAALQKWIDSGISKTTNLPSEYTVEDVGNIYMDMWKRGCKGGTVFRDASRTTQVLEGIERKKKQMEFPYPERTKVPGLSIDGKTWVLESPSGKLRTTVNHYPEITTPYEVYLKIGKVGSEVTAITDAFARVMSLFLQIRSPIPTKRRLALLMHQMEGIGGSDQVGFGPDKVRSIPDTIAKALQHHLNYIDDHTAQSCGDETSQDPKIVDHKGLDICPGCGSLGLRAEEGCNSCAFCGYSRC